ncbi:MAG: GGDEF domain-containing protein [Phycisphaerales bacterium]|nr:MAG: GGDEF domain-containing protein [Phycisphaerales bacterium]
MPDWPSSTSSPEKSTDRLADEPEELFSSSTEGEDEETADPGPLGDTDLVRAIMEHPDGVRETAVALLREQTGWDSLTLLDPPKDDDHGAIVEANGLVFGELRAAEATAEELTPWAEWLAYWLELDRTYADFRHKAYHDWLTGAWNRRYFVDFLEQVIAEASKRRRPITLMVFDIDDFKRYNDQYGHAAGDEILRETVRLLNSVIRSEDRVCRIGGDEFAVIFADLDKPRSPGSEPPHTVDQIAQRFQEQICDMRFPKLGIDAPGTLSISAGLATYPWDGDDPIKLLRHADELALRSKNSGKNAITLGPGAQRVCGRPRQED